MPNPVPPVPLVRQVGRTLEMAAVLTGPLSLLMLSLSPASYLCWWGERYVRLVSWEGSDWLQAQAWCSSVGATQFQIEAPLWGLPAVPLLALLLGWASRNAHLHWGWRVSGAALGAWSYWALVTYFFWLAAKS